MEIKLFAILENALINRFNRCFYNFSIKFIMYLLMVDSSQSQFITLNSIIRWQKKSQQIGNIARVNWLHRISAILGFIFICRWQWKSSHIFNENGRWRRGKSTKYTKQHLIMWFYCLYKTNVKPHCLFGSAGIFCFTIYNILCTMWFHHRYFASFTVIICKDKYSRSLLCCFFFFFYSSHISLFSVIIACLK